MHKAAYQIGCNAQQQQTEGLVISAMQTDQPWGLGSMEHAEPPTDSVLPVPGPLRCGFL